MASNDFRNKLMSLEGNLLNYAFMLTSDRDMARQLLESTRRTVLEQWADASAGASFKGWAFSVMRGIFNSQFSRRRVLCRDVDVYTLKFSEASQRANVYRPEGAYMSAEVTEAIASLTPNCRRVAEMYFSGYGAEEIAAELELPLKVVKSRVAYCRCRIRIVLSA